jgi:hypothetical protein
MRNEQKAKIGPQRKPARGGFFERRDDVEIIARNWRLARGDRDSPGIRPQMRREAAKTVDWNPKTGF